jgi:hypothetical protein
MGRMIEIEMSLFKAERRLRHEMLMICLRAVYRMIDWDRLVKMDKIEDFYWSFSIISSTCTQFHNVNFFALARWPVANLYPS